MDVIRKIGELPPGELAAKALKWGRSKIGRVTGEWWARAGGMEVKPSELPGLVSGSPLTPHDAAVQLLQCIVHRGRVADSVFKLVTVNGSCSSRFSDKVSGLLAEADRLCDRQFRILGEDIDYSSGILWHYDPRNDHEFEAGEFHTKVTQFSPDGGMDIKYPWELSRLQHLPKLSLAYRLTGDRKYLVALHAQTMDWLARNPVGFGPNWVCTMDVAIRAANMSLAYAIAGEDGISGELAVDLARSFIAHGRYIIDHLEWWDKLTSNHYLSDISGLAVLSCLTSPTLLESDAWLQFARDELHNEIRKQVYDDGWDYEASTGYHRLVLECFLIPAIVFQHNGIRMDPDYMSRLVSMVMFVRDITLPDGSFPLIGDNDSGMFVSLQPREIGDLNYLIMLGAAFLGDPALKPETPGGRSWNDPDVLWLIGENGLRRFDGMPSTCHRRTPSYPDGGLWILRSSDCMDMCTFRLGKVGQKGHGGHAHNDQLSVTVWFDGAPVVVDPGTSVYSSDPVKRNWFRSTAAHATIAIGDVEQNAFVDGALFTLPQQVKTRFTGTGESEDETRLEGLLLGYGPWQEHDIKITRRIVHDHERRYFEIEDKLAFSDEVEKQEIVWRFPLAPGLIADARGAGLIKVQREDGTRVAEVLYQAGWKFNAVDSIISPEYGVELPGVTLEFRPPSEKSHAKFIFRAASQA
jgi:hypothetical protein